MVDYRSKLLPETMRSFDTSTLTGSYQAFGSVLAFPSRILIFVNSSSAALTISWDGTNDHMILLPGTAFTLDQTANAVSGATFGTAAKTQIYLKGTATVSAPTNFAYLTTFFAI